MGIELGVEMEIRRAIVEELAGVTPRLAGPIDPIVVSLDERHLNRCAIRLLGVLDDAIDARRARRDLRSR